MLRVFDTKGQQKYARGKINVPGSEARNKEYRRIHIKNREKGYQERIKSRDERVEKAGGKPSQGVFSKALSKVRNTKAREKLNEIKTRRQGDSERKSRISSKNKRPGTQIF